MRIAILASGNGTNFEAIMEAKRKGQINAEICLLFSDKAQAPVLKKAEKYGIMSVCFEVHEFASKQAYETKLCDLLLEKKIDLVVLAGYMRIMGAILLEAFPDRIINIHPALLPSFPGLHGIRDAFDYGVKVTGVTIHFVDRGVDSGPIIAQEAVKITPSDDLETLEAKIHEVEHRLYPQVIAELLEKSNQ